MKLLIPFAVALALAPQAALAVITFTQLDDDVFLVSHRVKGIGSRGKATKMVYTKAASLCLAAGYSHFRVLDQESAATQEYEAANASLRVRFFLEDGDERIDCDKSADPTYVGEARVKLANKGYVPPATVPGQASEEGRTPTAEKPTAETGICTIEQIAAMARAGLTDEQIKAACVEEPPESRQ